MPISGNPIIKIRKIKRAVNVAPIILSHTLSILFSSFFIAAQKHTIPKINIKIENRFNSKLVTLQVKYR
jgi:hypothetical protein